jgi:hypothetical protein
MLFRSGGEVVRVDADAAWAGRLVARAVGTGAAPDDAFAAPTVVVRIEGGTSALSGDGLRPITRGAYSDGVRTLLTNACGSGFDLLVAVGDRLDVTARYRPGVGLRAANLVLRRRFALLTGQVLVHYPVLWWAGLRGRVPLHASVLRTGNHTLLLAGPGGVGKSTAVLAGLAAGGVATTDNLCAADGTHCFGIAEPLRTDAPPRHRGARTSHGRIEVPLAARVAMLEPDRLVLLERGRHNQIAPLSAAQAARALVAGTYAAGELRRYWAFAATLALATGRGPAHPPVAAVAARYAERLAGRRVRVGDGVPVPMADLSGPDPVSAEGAIA